MFIDSSLTTSPESLIHQTSSLKNTQCFRTRRRKECRLQQSYRFVHHRSCLYQKPISLTRLTEIQVITVSVCFVPNTSGWGTKINLVLFPIYSASRRKLLSLENRTPCGLMGTTKLETAPHVPKLLRLHQPHRTALAPSNRRSKRPTNQMETPSGRFRLRSQVQERSG